ncbi:hypothetical protein GW17_00056358 [Ensete ventricosum]|nr:hypothetical protein GW17_00056358 [Ensete ventricosum]RZS01373.1 hypothetical protein BHM03_00031218 [Ensete ventricosum]
MYSGQAGLKLRRTIRCRWHCPRRDLYLSHNGREGAAKNFSKSCPGPTSASHVRI